LIADVAESYTKVTTVGAGPMPVTRTSVIPVPLKNRLFCPATPPWKHRKEIAGSPKKYDAFVVGEGMDNHMLIVQPFDPRFRFQPVLIPLEYAPVPNKQVSNCPPPANVTPVNVPKALPASGYPQFGVEAERLFSNL